MGQRKIYGRVKNSEKDGSVDVARYGRPSTVRVQAKKYIIRVSETTEESSLMKLFLKLASFTERSDSPEE
jgi:hypothetical protein